MGGMCEEKITGATPDDIIANGMTHLDTAHPEMAASIRSMGNDHPAIVEWREKFMKTWETTPEDQ